MTTRSWATWSPPSTVVVDGVDTAYRRGGAGPLVLFVHGDGLSRGWFPIDERLARGADVVVPELPGFGDTPRPDAYRGWEDWILHLDGFRRELGLERFHLVGEGFGAWVAAEFAVRYPDRIESLALVAPVGLRLPDVSTVDVFRLDDGEADEVFFNGRRSAVADLLVQEGGLEDELQRGREAAAVAVLAWNPRYDAALERRLGRVTASALVVGVDDDRVASNAMAQAYAAALPAGRRERITGDDGRPSSHRVAWEQPGEVAEVVLAHIRGAAERAGEDDER